MVMLVTLKQASDHLRRDTSDDDSDLVLKIEAASQAVINYAPGSIFFDSYGDPEDVPPPVQSAVLLILGDLYSDRDMQNFREGGNAQRLGEITLSRTVHFLLDPYRQPTIA
jgi:hypothetical protein